MSSTIMSFWQMVWEADVYLIVQLTGTQEDGAVQYCPGLCDRCLESDQVLKLHEFLFYIISILQLAYLSQMNFYLTSIINMFCRQHEVKENSF